MPGLSSEPYRAKGSVPSGTDIVWTDEIERTAETLWRLPQEPSGAILSPDAFGRWRELEADTLASGARALGAGRRVTAYCEQGGKPIPRVVALAVRALDQSYRRGRGR